MNNQHDHTMASHSAKCDEEGCTYVAMTHAHDDDGAVLALSEDLAKHNLDEHQKETDPQEILEAVKAKMKVSE